MIFNCAPDVNLIFRSVHELQNNDERFFQIPAVINSHTTQSIVTYDFNFVPHRFSMKYLFNHRKLPIRDTQQDKITSKNL